MRSMLLICVTLLALTAHGQAMQDISGPEMGDVHTDGTGVMLCCEEAGSSHAMPACIAIGLSLDELVVVVSGYEIDREFLNWRADGNVMEPPVTPPRFIRAFA